MSPTPTGTLWTRPDGGVDLTVSRRTPEPVETVWAQLTEREKTATWFGPWRGEAGAGSTIEVQMAFEEGDAWATAVIDRCDPPRSYAVTTSDEAGSWHLEVQVHDYGTDREVRLIHHLDSAEGVGEIGPGWEYYLDLFAASLTGAARPSFDAYYPEQKSYYESLV